MVKRAFWQAMSLWLWRLRPVRCVLQQQVAAVGCGFAEITRDKVVVITDFAQKPDEIDVEHAERVKVRAEERIREKKSQIEFAHSQAELARAMAKLKVARKSSASLGR